MGQALSTVRIRAASLPIPPSERVPANLEVVWRGRLGGCIHGGYFCDRWEVGCECEQALASQLTPKSRPPSSCRSARRAPGICRSLRKLQERGAYSASGLHRELNRVKERSHECMAPSRFRGVPATDLPVFRQGFWQTRRPARQGRRGPHYRPKVRLQSQPWHMYSGVIVRCILAASTLEGGKTAAKSVMAVAAHREEFEFDHHCSGPNLDVTSNDIIRRIERYSA